MTLKESVLQSLNNSLMNEYCMDAMVDADFGQFDLTDNTVILVGQQCWSKITYLYGLIGPEVMFFCNKDPITKKWMPDLEQTTVKVRQIDASDLLNGKQSQDMSYLISQFVSVQNVTRLIS